MNTKPKKKIQPKIPKKASARGEAKKKPLSTSSPAFALRHENSWVSIGFDTSPSSLAGAAIGYDAMLDKMYGPAFVMRRWSKADHYFDRIEMCARSHELVIDLLSELKMVVPLECIYIAHEEPWPPGMASRGVSGWLKQQAEISGAFTGGLLRYGYRNIWQIGSDKWRATVRDGLIEDGKVSPELTLHYSKWRSEELAVKYHCNFKDSGKWRAKEWALYTYGPWAGQQQGIEIPDWPDIIGSKDGQKPRPEGSKARAVQPDDRYDALAMMEFMRQELVRQGVAK